MPLTRHTWKKQTNGINCCTTFFNQSRVTEINCERRYFSCLVFFYCTRPSSSRFWKISFTHVTIFVCCKINLMGYIDFCPTGYRIFCALQKGNQQTFSLLLYGHRCNSCQLLGDNYKYMVVFTYFVSLLYIYDGFRGLYLSSTSIMQLQHCVNAFFYITQALLPFCGK